MSNKNKEAVELTKEELELANKMQEEGTMDVQAALIGYAKRMNGYPYISASRITCYPPKDARASVLFDMLSMNYLIKNAKNPDAAKDFMEVFGNGRIGFIQAHTKCPTVGPDGLYDQRTPTGEHIKSQILGHFTIPDEEASETKDEYAEKDYSYMYKDANNGMLVDIGVDINVPLKEYYAKHGTLYKKRTIPAFEPLIVVKTGNGTYGRIDGNPYHTVTTQEVAEMLKLQQAREDAPIEE